METTKIVAAMTTLLNLNVFSNLTIGSTFDNNLFSFSTGLGSFSFLSFAGSGFESFCLSAVFVAGLSAGFFFLKFIVYDMRK